MRTGQTSWLDIFDIDTLDDGSVTFTYWDRSHGCWLSVNSFEPAGIAHITNSPMGA